MTHKEYLQQPYLLRNSINEKLIQFSQAGAMATKTTTTLSGIPGSGGTSDKVGTWAVRLCDLSAELEADKKRLEGLKKCVARSIDEIDSEQYRLLLRLRYLQFKEWHQIAEVMGMTKNHVKYKLHEQAILELKTQYRA